MSASLAERLCRAGPSSSNTISSQGDVYAKIIEGVIEASKVDFEENGVSSITLQEMKQVSQCSLGVFSCDACVLLRSLSAAFAISLDISVAYPVCVKEKGWSH